MTRKSKTPCSCVAVPGTREPGRTVGHVFDWRPCPDHYIARVRDLGSDKLCACVEHFVDEGDHLDERGWWHTGAKCFRGPA